jgi:integrase
MEFKKETYTSGQKALTEGQVEKILSFITNLEDLALIKLAICTGIRRKDIVSIKKKDVDFENNTITFYEHKKKRTKTVPLNLNLATTLKMWIEVSKSDWLFPTRFIEKKQHMSSRTAYNILRRNTRKASLPDIPFHALRATCVKLCQRKGWTPEQTAELLGDRISTIQKHYSTPSFEEMKEVANNKAIL